MRHARQLGRLNHAVLRWAGSLLSDVTSQRTPSLRWSRTDSSSLRKSARRSRLFSLDALAASATMAWQDRPGLALIYDMARERPRRLCPALNVNFQHRGQCATLACSNFNRTWGCTLPETPTNAKRTPPPECSQRAARTQRFKVAW